MTSGSVVDILMAASRMRPAPMFTIYAQKERSSIIISSVLLGRFSTDEPNEFPAIMYIQAVD